MKILYAKVCVPLMLISNNVYTFISGIFVALSINIFTSLCLEEYSICSSWHLYLSTLIFLFVSALCIYLATRLNGFQNYIIQKCIIDYTKKQKIAVEATQREYVKFTLIYILLLIMFIFGVALLILNFVII